MQDIPQEFKALVVDKVDGQVTSEIKTLSTDQLPDEDVLIEVAYSSLNYKDGLALGGKRPICRTFPMVAGIDLAGTVLESRSPNFKAGDQVLVNGYGLAETFWGGYSQLQRVKSEFIQKVPAAFTLQQTMAIGTAGYTAMLCVLALEDAGVTPAQGEILVTGAGGGVGSVAIALLAKLGYRVVASTGRPSLEGFFKDLGAESIIDRKELESAEGPMQRERWAGVVDVVGSTTLANAIAQTKYLGAVAICGLAAGIDLPATVMPFILRSVKLIGCDSVQAPMPIRERAWQRLAQDLNTDMLAKVTQVEPMSNVKQLASDILAGKTQGRVVIDVNA